MEAGKSLIVVSSELPEVMGISDRILIMCEGPNELEIIRMLLEHDKMIFTEDDLLNLVPYHARQIGNNAAVKAALNLYHGDVHVLRIGDVADYFRK